MRQLWESVKEKEAELLKLRVELEEALVEIEFLRAVNDGYRKELQKLKRIVSGWVFVGDEGEEGC